MNFDEVNFFVWLDILFGEQVFLMQNTSLILRGVLINLLVFVNNILFNAKALLNIFSFWSY